MHKLLLSWCDIQRGWSLRAGGRDHIHLAALYRDWKGSEELIKPFLILHICYCVHDYRRMGQVLNDMGITIPGVENLLRTLVIPIEQLFNEIAARNINIQEIAIQYRRVNTVAHENEAPQAYFERICRRENHRVVAESGNGLSIELPIESLAELGNDVVDFFQECAH
jgi:hypothetical protein